MPQLRILAVLILLACISPVVAAFAQDDIAPEDRIENWKGKTVLVFSPHPDDDTFGCGGTIKKLTNNGNKVVIVMYTNGDKGSLDPEMTSERLARIRKAEDEAANAVLGVPKENIVWLGYEDGNFEYADPQRVRGEACKLIKQYRPDAVFTIDPGSEHERWHKTDHRMAAFITKDAFIAAEWHLYYPQHLMVDNLKPYKLPVAYYYYSTESNYTVDISDAWEAKLEAASKHVSQFEPSLSRYTPVMPDEAFQMLRKWGEQQGKEGDKFVEKFRRELEP